MKKTKSWCIIVPYRDREEHRDKFVAHYNRLFSNVPIYLIEQNDDKPFNRGKLLNIGAKEYGSRFDYFALHDIDMLCHGVGNYGSPINPTHIATQCRQFGYKMPYPKYFGGVNIFTYNQFYYVNGFPNKLIGWGGEDDLLRMSFEEKGLKIDRRPCRFNSLDHERKIDGNNYHHNIEMVNKGRDWSDGLSSLEYTITSEEQKQGYILLKVKI